MKLILFFFIFTIFFTSAFTRASEDNSNQKAKDFIMLSILKSGTHLLTKLLTLLTGREKDALVEFLKIPPNETLIEQRMLNLKANNRFAYQHFSHPTWPFLENFAKEHLQYLKILEIRDLRDLIISALHHHAVMNEEDPLEAEMGYKASLDEKLTFFLDLPRSKWAMGFVENINQAIELIKDPEVVVVRFEDIIGPSGGGSRIVQRRAIAELASHLGIPLSSKKLRNIEKNLFGGPDPTYPTFRQGKIGSWKKYFKSKHEKLFKKNWEPFQKALGYPKNRSPRVVTSTY